MNFPFKVTISYENKVLVFKNDQFERYYTYKDIHLWCEGQGKISLSKQYVFLSSYSLYFS